MTVETDSRHLIFRKFLQRCGFSLDGVMRKHRVVHNRNRDTALYSMLNSDWEDIEIKIKTHIGISVKPVMHNVIEIDSGIEVENQILRDKVLRQQEASGAGGSKEKAKKKKKIKKK